jgi:hypothetical protein
VLALAGRPPGPDWSAAYGYSFLETRVKVVFWSKC